VKEKLLRMFVDPAREMAERLVTAWLENDFQPDPEAAGWMDDESLARLTDRVADVYAGQTLSGGKQGGAMKAGIGTPSRVVAAATTMPDIRRPTCPSYSVCLDYAIGRGWAGMSCRACKGPGTGKILADGSIGPLQSGAHDDE